MRAETSQHSNARHALKALQLVSRMMAPKLRSCCSGMQIASRRFAKVGGQFNRRLAAARRNSAAKAIPSGETTAGDSETRGEWVDA